MVDLTGHRVYLDASTIIYALENIQFANLRHGLLAPLDAGRFTVVTSEITLVETLVGPRKARDLEAEAKYRVFLTPSEKLRLVPVSSQILERVIDLRAEFGLKTPDAIHIATGLLSGCDVFVTGDQAWSRTGVTVLDPVEFA